MRARAEVGDPVRVKDLVTPEGVALHVGIARAGDRVVAFLIDNVIVIGLMAVLAIAALMAAVDMSSWISAFVILGMFLLQNFYFIYFEARRGGATPGKRRSGIRVIDASGGTLTVQAVVVRNVMRNLEFYLPLFAFFTPEQFWPGLPGWAQLLAAAWLFVLAGLPFFNKDRLRVGDLVAGTLVVEEPAAVLLADLGRRTATRPTAASVRFEFTKEQLDVYGEYELQVLEDVLRKEGSPRAREDAIGAVTKQIAKKIRYPERIRRTEQRTFLLEFYAALRARLEQRRLFGRRKADKYGDVTEA